jgi:hypothetical protein
MHLQLRILTSTCFHPLLSCANEEVDAFVLDIDNSLSTIDPYAMSLFDLYDVDSVPTPCDDLGVLDLKG